MVNADDFGLSEGINRGILSAFHEGILRSASLMPNGAAFTDAVSLARNNPDLGVGIHLSLVDERCVANAEAVRGLADKDSMLPGSYTSFVKGYFLKNFGISQIRAEMEAQVQKFLETGLKPTHIDSHQHLHIMPGIFEAVLEIAEKSDIRVVRVPLERGGVFPRSFDMRGASLIFLNALCGRASRKARASGFLVADHFWGLDASGRMNEENLVRALNSLRPGVNEIMCHPGFSDAASRQRYPWGYQWDEEAAALKSESVRKIISDNNVRLASFREIQ
ncbi:MAG TPA: ChbG/HpnK family deacetylase [Armatimonadota bacterium]